MSELELSASITAAILERRSREFIKTLGTDAFTTSTGGVKFTTGVATICTIETALLRLHDLHLRCVGSEPLLTASSEVTRATAQGLFRVGAGALLCQMQMLPAASATAFLTKVVAIATQLDSTEGLESIFVTALVGTITAGESSIADESLTKWEAVGWPDVVGADLGFLVAYDRTIGFARFDSGGLLQLGAAGNARRVRDLVQMRDARWGMSTGQCKGLSKLGGMIGGAVAGAVVSGGSGAVVGATLGYGVGDAFADIVCEADDDKPPKPEPPDPDSGCVPNPLWGDFAHADPFAAYASRSGLVAVPMGDGLDAFAIRDAAGSVLLTGLPQLSVTQDNVVRLERAGFLDGSSAIRNALARDLKDMKLRDVTGIARTRVRTMSQGFTRNDKLPPLPIASDVSKDAHLDPADLEKARGYRVETKQRFVPGVNEKGENVLVEVSDYVIHCEPGSLLYIMFGPIIEGDRAAILAQYPGLLVVLSSQPGNVDPAPLRDTMRFSDRVQTR